MYHLPFQCYTALFFLFSVLRMVSILQVICEEKCFFFSRICELLRLKKKNVLKNTVLKHVSFEVFFHQRILEYF